MTDGAALGHSVLATIAARVVDLALFRGVLDDDVGQAFRALVAALAEEASPRSVRAFWGRLFTLLAAEAELAVDPLVGDAWQNHLLDRLLADDNPFSRKAQRASLEAMGSALVGQAYDELAVLQGLYALDAHCLQAAALRLAPTERWLGWDGFRPLPTAAGAAAGAAHAFKQRLAAATEWGLLLPALAEHYGRAGTGLFARYRAFR